MPAHCQPSVNLHRLTALAVHPALSIDRQQAFLPGDDHFLKQLGVLCKFYFSKIYLRIPYCDFTFLCDTLNISGKYPLSYN
ncbi:Uncharacterised protein [Segatella copri]|nr:Uncharacterised protein [Segatella copri]